jgi:acyl carrier protein
MQAEPDEEIIATLTGIVAEVTGISENELPRDASLREDFMVDSLAVLEIVTLTESRLGCRISDDDVDRFVSGSISDAAKWLVSHRTPR